MDKDTKHKLADLFTTVLFAMFAVNERIEVLECHTQVQAARIDTLNGKESTRPACLNEFITITYEPTR